MKAWYNNIDRPRQPPLTNNEAEENNYQEEEELLIQIRLKIHIKI